MKILFTLFFLFFSNILFSYELLISGNEKLNLNDIQNITSLDINNKNLELSEINQIVSDLYQSEIIYDVNAVFDKNKVFINITESKIIENIYINGNLFINDDILIKNISSKQSSLLNRSKISNDISQIRRIYASSGYDKVEINSSTENLSSSKINLIFNITENTSSKLVKIDFLGNNFFSDSYLKNRITSKSSSFFNFFEKGSNLDSSIFDFDLNILKDLYSDYGFFNANISYELISNLSNNYNLVFYINELERLKIHDVKSLFELDNPDNQYNEYIRKLESKLTKNNNFFDYEIINNSIEEINLFNKENNIFNKEIFYELKIEDNKNILYVEERSISPQILNKIEFVGNSITKDKTLRSKIELQPGDYFSDNDLLKLKNKLSRLKYIEKVNISKKDNLNKTDISIDLSENKKTGSFLFGGSFSGDTGLGLGLGVKDINFLGSGNEINSNINLNEEYAFFDIKYTQYPLTNYSVKNNYSVFNSETDLTDSFGFKKYEFGFGYGISFDYSNTTTISNNFRIYNQRNHSAINSLELVTDNIGNSNNIEYSLSLISDTTDDILYPKKGMLNSLSFSIRPSLFSSSNSFKIRLSNDIYKNIKDSSFFFVSNDIGATDSFSGRLKTIDSFSLGGLNFKGFDYRGIGPYQGNTYLGGKKYFTSTLGYGDNFIFDDSDNINVKIFYTIGSIWDSDYSNDDNFKLRSSAGISLDFYSVLPISLSYAIPITKKATDKLREFTFNIGTSF